jgi:hypothetical protein
MKAHTYTDTRMLNVHGTNHAVVVFVCVAAGVVSKYFLFLCLLNALFQIMQVSNASWKSLISVWLNVAIPKIRCDTLSGEEMYSIHWICPVLFEVLETCIHVHHWLATNDFHYSDGFTDRIWWISAYFFIGVKVVVQLPSKDIDGKDFTSWMIILRNEIVGTFGLSQDFSVCAYLSSCSQDRGVCLCLPMHTSVCTTHIVTVN